MAENDAKPHPSQGPRPPHGSCPADLALHELLLVEALSNDGIFSLMDALEYVRERYLTDGNAASLVYRAASQPDMARCFLWSAHRVGAEEIRPLLRRAVELAFAESGLSTMPRIDDAADKLQRETERQRDVRLSNTVFKCLVRASGRARKLAAADAGDTNVLY